MLSEEEKAALERVRCVREKLAAANGLGEKIAVLFGVAEEYQADSSRLIEVMLRDLFPVREIGGLVIRYDDEITPERLIACGGSNYPSDDYIAFRGGEIGLAFWCKTGQWDIEDHRTGSGVGHRNSCWRVFRPRNMAELWSLMERCEIEVPK